MAGNGKMPRQGRARTVVSRNLLWVRLLFDLNRARFAEGFNVDYTLWRRWEMGKNYPDPDVMVALCDRFGVTMDFLYRSRLSGLPEELLRKLLEKHPELRATTGAAVTTASPEEGAAGGPAAPEPNLPRVGRRPKRKNRPQQRAERREAE